MDLETRLKLITRARVGVVGDFCVDSYYFVDDASSEPSLETGLPTRPVKAQRHSLGGAGNVAANLAAMGVGSVQCFGVAGPDPQGATLRALLHAIGAADDGILLQQGGWQTPCYLKPIAADGSEGGRFDFGRFNACSAETTAGLLAALERSLPDLDILVINQQIDRGIHTAAFQDGLDALLRRDGRIRALVDCRTLPEAYPTGIRKVNDFEATRQCGARRGPRDAISRDEAVQAARRLHDARGLPVFVTRGKHGCIAVDSTGVHEIPGLSILRPVDTVGAGDSMVAGIAAALATGAEPAEAAAFGNFVAGVTVQKLHQTGTATPAEIRAIGLDPDYVYNPELAADPRLAAHIGDTQIEIVPGGRPGRAPRFAIFDHDGTLSTLRRGWEQTMESVMVRAILGASYPNASRSALEAVRQQVLDFIDRTTGVQTLRQMQGLVEMVRDGGHVPAQEVLDAHGYKRVYNGALMAVVEQRLARLRRGELGVEDFTLRNAPELLRRLRRGGVRLYLASGTDEADVVREAEALGYAGLFEGGIHGANQDMGHDPKRRVIEGILGEIGSGQAGCIVTFGDGPVEIRETRKRGGLCVGVAGDEAQRFGLDEHKRARVIRSGAHLVVPDYSQLDALLAAIGLAP